MKRLSKNVIVTVATLGAGALLTDTAMAAEVVDQNLPATTTDTPQIVEECQHENVTADQVAQAKDQVTEAQDAVAQNQAQITEVQDQVASLEGDLTSLEGELKETQTNTPILQEKIDQANQDLSQAQEDLTSLKGQESTQLGQVVEARTNEAQAQAQLAQAQADYEKAQADLANLQNQLSNVGSTQAQEEALAKAQAAAALAASNLSQAMAADQAVAQQKASLEGTIAKTEQDLEDAKLDIQKKEAEVAELQAASTPLYVDKVVINPDWKAAMQKTLAARKAYLDAEGTPQEASLKAAFDQTMAAVTALDESNANTQTQYELSRNPLEKYTKYSANGQLSDNNYKPLTYNGVLDPNNLPEDVTLELAFMVRDLINSVRREFGIQDIQINTNEMAFAKEVAAKYVAVNNEPFSSHDGAAINAVAQARGLDISAPLGEQTTNQYYENLGTFTTVATRYDKEHLFLEVANFFDGFVFEGDSNQYSHLFSLLEIDSFGLDLSQVEGYNWDMGWMIDETGKVIPSNGKSSALRIHILGVNDPSYLVTASTPAAQASLYNQLYGPSSAPATDPRVNQVNPDLTAALEALKQLKAYEGALEAVLEKAQKTLAALPAPQTPAALAAYEPAQAELIKAISELKQAQENVKNAEEHAKLLQEQITAQEQFVLTTETILETAKEAADQAGQEANDLLEQLALTQKAIEEKKDQIKTLEELLEQLKAQLASQKDPEAILRKIAEVESQLPPLRDKLAVLTNEKPLLEEKLKESEKEYACILGSYIAQNPVVPVAPGQPGQPGSTPIDGEETEKPTNPVAPVTPIAKPNPGQLTDLSHQVAASARPAASASVLPNTGADLLHDDYVMAVALAGMGLALAKSRKREA